ncbi:hypothetical protein A2U01_0056039, partial [Trifolium medium]|nr:hypothetical protein [Trifolium medium]
ARLAIASDPATESLPSTDNWRELATMSPPPRPATSRMGPGALWRQACRTEYLVAV